MKLNIEKNKSKSKNNYYYLIPFILILLFFFIVNIFSGSKAEVILQAITEKNDLDTIYLNINFKGLQKIEQKRLEAIIADRLVSSDADFIKAKISFRNKTNSCQIRLKGDLSDHWAGDKFSLRVEMKNDDLIMGMSKFSLQDPSTRNEISEYLFLNDLKFNDCLAVKYDFVNLVINGKNKGIYANEEHFSKDFIESNNRRVGAIAAFNDSLVWQMFSSTNINLEKLIKSMPVKVRDKKNLFKNESLIKQHDSAINLVRAIQDKSLPPATIFDSKYLGKFLALVRIWSAEHCLEIDDINFFFNPVTCKLEPIGFDGLSGRYPETPFCYFSGGFPKNNWYNYALSSNELAYEYINHLNQFSRLNTGSRFNKEIIAKAKKVKNLRIREIALNYPKVFINNFDRLMNLDPWNNVKEIQKQIINELDTDDLLKVDSYPIENSNFIKVVITNTTTHPIVVNNLILGKKKFEAFKFTLDKHLSDSTSNINDSLIIPPNLSSNNDAKQEYIFLLPAKNYVFNNAINEILVECKFLGLSNYKSISTSLDQTYFNPLKLPNFTNKLPYSFIQDGKKIIVPSGTHNVRDSIHVSQDESLIIKPGAILNFDTNAISLILKFFTFFALAIISLLNLEPVFSLLN